MTFRDIVSDGNLQSAYSIFPVTSNNVLVELSKVFRVNDAPLYIGQSSSIVVRYNDVRDSVAGIEIENCGNAQVYGNYSANNTGGILVFKDGSLPVQLAQCHEVHHNVFENNNTPNFGAGTVAGVPDGTGMLIISVDTTPFHHNISRGNNTVRPRVPRSAGGVLRPAVQRGLDPDGQLHLRQLAHRQRRHARSGGRLRRRRGRAVRQRAGGQLPVGQHLRHPGRVHVEPAHLHPAGAGVRRAARRRRFPDRPEPPTHNQR